MNTSPIIWIEELRILRSFSPDVKEEVRKITFRQGLNIVWATVSSETEPELPGFGGHAAGKTSLCRLIRFVLGERHYGSRFMRDRILKAFENGWVVAKIWVDQTSWIVARAFRSGPHPVALQTDTVESIFIGEEDLLPFAEFRKALEELVIAPFPLHEFPSEKEPITFGHLLEWMSRDQECRLSGLLDWRHQSSDHGSPEMSAAQKRFLIRDSLHLVDDLVRKEIEKRSPLEKELSAIPDELDFERRNLQQGLSSLRSALYPQEVPDVAGSLFVDTIRRLAQTKRDAELLPLKISEQALNVGELQRKLNELNQDLGAKKFQEKELQDYLEKQQTSLEEAKNDGTEAAYDRFWENLRPTDQHCRVPISIARFRCPLRQEFEPESSASSLKPDFLAIEEAAKSIIQNLQIALVPIKEAKGKLEDAVDDLRLKIASAEQQASQIRNEYSEVTANHTLTIFRADQAVAACDRIEKLEACEKKLEVEIEESKLKQEALQERQKNQLSDFSSVYESTLKAFLGSGIEARCRFTREEISLHADYRGELSSGAIDTLKTLAFDIAVLRMSILGKGHHPRFIIFDSPREADMHPIPYQRIFHHLKSLESETLQSPFQVILTTTEPPPARYQQSKETVLLLDASNQKERLFRTDF
ncbi:MAG: hypothetical protein ABIT76_06350 [Chthoniobacterales bacterium]